VITALLVSVGCGSSETLKDGIFTPAEWTAVMALSPMPDHPPPNTTNMYADNPQAAALGQKLFYDTRFSGPILNQDSLAHNGVGAPGDVGKVSCQTCHQAPWFVDFRSMPNQMSLGNDWFPRNATTMVNTAYYTGWREWEGVNDTIWTDACAGSEVWTSGNGSRLAAAHLLYDHYRDDYNAIFYPPLDPSLDANAPDAARFPADGKPKPSPDAPDGAWEMMAPADQDIITRIFVNRGKALEAFIRLLVSRNAPFDQYVAGDTTAISTSAKRGLRLFVTQGGCNACHAGPTFTDEKFHNLGVPDTYPAGIMGYDPNLWSFFTNLLDTGHAGGPPYAMNNPLSRDGVYSDDTTTPLLKNLTVTDADMGTYRTPSLRNVAMTPPYEHLGQFAMLEDVVRFDNMGGGTPGMGFPGTKDAKMKPLNLSDGDIADIVAFLETLTGEQVDQQYWSGQPNP
jgi:cytochrome c peroxidase